MLPKRLNAHAVPPLRCLPPPGRSGYALSESSEATNVLSGMSSCTLEGYARIEPSPRGLDYTFMAGLLQFPKPLLPWYANNADESSAYFSSALWQPFPFNNFNFLFDKVRSQAAAPPPPPRPYHRPSSLLLYSPCSSRVSSLLSTAHPIPPSLPPSPHPLPCIRMSATSQCATSPAARRRT